jgi:hypothetical protein
MDIDPNTVFDALGKLGVAGLAIWWFAKRDDKNRDQAEAREVAAAVRCREDAMSLRAEASLLQKRITEVENRQYDDNVEIIRAAIEALRNNAKAFEHWSKVETDRYPALDPKGHQ